MTITLDGKQFTAPEGSLLSDFLGLHSPIELPCGGKGKCAKCRVIAHGQLSPHSCEETNHLTPAELTAGVRLACCCTALGDCVIETISPTKADIQVAGVMPHFTPNHMFSRAGVAIDLGTTTLAGLLYDKSGLLCEATALNPQSAFGADVISRLEKAMEGQSNQLADSIRTALSELISELCNNGGISTHDIDSMVITGNTAMLHLLTRQDPTPLTHAPFEAERLFGEYMPAVDLSLPCPSATVYLPRCISAFVGADITTALLSSDICGDTGTALLCDIGTNGEIALWHDGELYCCSTAAGPAFEGAGLSMGMGGKAGAIRSVKLEGDRLQVEVIGDLPPIGICGSGAIDAVACLLQNGSLDETGLLCGDPTIIAPPVSLTQQDVRMIQLAKSAICAGIETILAKRNLVSQQIERTCIAGGFGSHVNLQNALRIGLLPTVCEDNTEIIGNAALSGAAMLLLCRDFVEKSLQIAYTAHVVELAGDSIFSNAYMNGMLFE